MIEDFAQELIRKLCDLDRLMLQATGEQGLHALTVSPKMQQALMQSLMSDRRYQRDDNSSLKKIVFLFDERAG